MNINPILKSIDKFQQRLPFLGLPLAIVKKYGDDDAGYQAALITYYGFLSLFPLLLVATSVIGIISLGDKALEAEIMASTSSYFPVIGDQLARNIQASTKSGPALVVGLILAFYGARGGSDAFRKTLNKLWRIPKKEQAGFPISTLKSLAMTGLGGAGLMAAALLSASASGLGRLFIFKILSLSASLLLLIPTFYFMFRISLPENRVSKHDLVFNAVVAAVGIVIIQALGGYLVTSQLKTLSPLYGTFALVLGLLFWIYLQIMVVLYTVEFTIVRSHKLWPRSLTGQAPTSADKSATTGIQ